MFGWRSNGSSHWSPQGECIGWVDAERIFLDPNAAYRTVQKAAKEAGEVLSISTQVMNKRLREQGLLAETDEKRGTLTIRRFILDHSRAVLSLHLSTLFPSDSSLEG